MALSGLWKTKADIALLEEGRDIPGLIRLLSTRDSDIVSEAIRALGVIGTEATPLLLVALRNPHRDIRLAALSALSAIRDPVSVPALVAMLSDRSSEVRWQASIVLGQIGERSVAGPLARALRDRDKYVRYGAALSLAAYEYHPADNEEHAWLFAARQEWERIPALGSASLPVLSALASDPDSDVRIMAVKTLGKTRDPGAGPALLRALADSDRQVRWEAALACGQCDVTPDRMPPALFARPRTTKSPVIAGFLNFMLPGLGYGYLGKWWGIMIFQIDITVTVWLFKIGGEFITYALLLTVYIVLAFHAWYITRTMPDEAP